MNHPPFMDLFRRGLMPSIFSRYTQTCLCRAFLFLPSQRTTGTWKKQTPPQKAKKPWLKSPTFTGFRSLICCLDRWNAWSMALGHELLSSSRRLEPLGIQTEVFQGVSIQHYDVMDKFAMLEVYINRSWPLESLGGIVQEQPINCGVILGSGFQQWFIIGWILK